MSVGCCKVVSPGSPQRKRTYVSEESEDQVMVALDPGVAELSCKFDTAVAVAANARATMALKGRVC